MRGMSFCSKLHTLACRRTELVLSTHNPTPFSKLQRGPEAEPHHHYNRRHTYFPFWQIARDYFQIGSEVAQGEEGDKSYYGLALA